MSIGNFVDVSYELDDGTTVLKARLQEETLQATFGATPNSDPGTTITHEFSAIANKGKRENGVGMRKVRCNWGGGGAPTGYTGSSFFLIVPDKSVYDALSTGDAVTYIGNPATIVKKIGEVLT